MRTRLSELFKGRCITMYEGASRHRLLSAKKALVYSVALLASLMARQTTGSEQPPSTAMRMVEWTIESQRTYTDGFNDVDVDVVFSKGGQTWRVPTFWRGGSRWTVRFSPPAPGIYQY